MKLSALSRQVRQYWQVKVFRRVGSGVALVTAFVLTVTLVSSVYSIPTALAGTPYDGVTLYRGIFFASGPVASKIPTIQRVASYVPADYKNLEAQMIKYIQGKDPKFFDNFAQEIQSGDRVRVGAAIKNARAVQREALVATTRNAKTKFAAQVARLRYEHPPEAENDANVDIAIIVVFGVLVLLAVVFEEPPLQRTAFKGLTFERLVDEIVRAVPKTEIKSRAA